MEPRVFAVGVLIVLFHVSFLQVCIAKVENPSCRPSSCGSIENISYPFRLKGDPPNCGHPDYELGCENNRTILSLFSGKYYVEEIRHQNNTIRIVDPGLKRENCSSFPRYSLTHSNFTRQYPYALANFPDLKVVSFVKCAKPVNASIGITLFNTSDSLSWLTNTYALLGVNKVTNVPASCSILVSVVTPSKAAVSEFRNCSICNLQGMLLTGVELSFQCPKCRKCEAGVKVFHRDYSLICRPYNKQSKAKDILKSIYCAALSHVNYEVLVSALLVGSRTLCGLALFLAVLIYKWRMMHLPINDNVEEFLQSQNNIMPIRYSYSEIRKMTKGFKEKLGEGGYGFVYKGKLRSGDLVAVKLLSKSKGNGQVFISEVATIERIHHVNVVKLIGFCSEGSKHALVYEFMPNGSLDKFIFSDSHLSWERTYEIALGVARGIEYLHQGCDMKILHFDIKPYNVLLDENFIPKVSDFGLARLYPMDYKTGFLTAARGTAGYIAPELVYKKIGGVSCKSDVYSFGKLLMEMVERRKKVNVHADHVSQMYFPTRIFEQFNRGEELELGDATEDEKKTARKMILVALWCIQLKPVDRPSMRQVVEMLQGEVESLKMPPELLLYPQDSLLVERTATTTTSQSVTSSCCSSMDSVDIHVSAEF